MKTFFFLVTLTFLNFSFVSAQNEEEIIKQIRQQFKTINDEIKTYAIKSDMLHIKESATDVDITAYYKGDQLMKVEEIFLGDMSETSNHYYFWNKQLFFIFSTNTYYKSNDGYTESIVAENRYYFSNNKQIRWLFGNSKKDKNSNDFKNREKAWLKEAAKFLLQ